jgi:hypothetical protein
VISVTPRSRFSPGERTPVHIVQEAGWAPQPVWTQRLEKKYFPLCRGSNLYRLVVQPVARDYTDWAIRLTKTIKTSFIIVDCRFEPGTSRILSITANHWLATFGWWIYIFSSDDGVGLVRKRGCLLTLAYYAFPRWYEFGERRWNDILTGENRKTRRKTSPSATLSTTNPIWIDPGSNPGLRGERPATNDLSHGTACWIYYFGFYCGGWENPLKVQSGYPIPQSKFPEHKSTALTATAFYMAELTVSSYGCCPVNNSR